MGTDRNNRLLDDACEDMPEDRERIIDTTRTSEGGAVYPTKNRGKYAGLTHDQRETIKASIRAQVWSASTKGATFYPARPKPTIHDEGKKRVGVYARVSTTSIEQTSSIENQTRYYTEKIENHPNWELQKIYSDEGKSGTSIRHRDAFQQMMEDAENGDMELILCASVSRFARNISDCITNIRNLRALHPKHPVGVFFETEQIYTLDKGSDQALEFHALLADWESAMKSSRMILSVDQRVSTGQYPLSDLLGFRHTQDRQLVIEPEEAKTVRYMFLARLLGDSADEVAAVLQGKQRPTMHGRTEWNGGMVRAYLSNERRWGDLHVRKTFVVDYVLKKTKRNTEWERSGAYIVGNHVGIVAPEMARAVRFLSSSSSVLEGGVPTIHVVGQGALKGFVRVTPGWNGVDAFMFDEVSKSVYIDEEIAEMEQFLQIQNEEAHSNVLSMQFAGYHVPYGVYFLNGRSPSMIISQRHIKFSKACHDKLGGCKKVEILYHPLVQMIAVRACEDDCEHGFSWVDGKGDPVQDIPAAAFTQAVYDKQNWIKSYRFRFRAVTRCRGDAKVLLFFLDEPQILIGKKQREALNFSVDNEEINNVRYVAYRNMGNEEEHIDDIVVPMTAYPHEWALYGIGVSYGMRKKRDSIADMMTEADILENGIEVDNPLIGVLPSRADIRNELEQLLLSM